MKIKLSDRERWLLVATGLVLVLYLFFQFFYLPKSKEIGSLRQKFMSQKRDLATAKVKAELLKSLEEGTLGAQRLKKTKEEQTIEALQHISKIISSLDLDLVSIKPHPEEVAVGAAKAILFDVDFSGSYNNVYKFMQALEKLPILILVDSIDLKRADKGDISVFMILSVYY